MRLQFKELTHNDDTIQHISHGVSETPRHIYIYIYIYIVLVWFSFMEHQPLEIINVKSILYI